MILCNKKSCNKNTCNDIATLTGISRGCVAKALYGRGRGVLLACLLVFSCQNNPPTLLYQFSATETWRLVGDIKAEDKVLKALSEGDKVLVNGETKNNAPYLKTRELYADISVKMEFMIPRGSNSGVYFMGRYEIQILDSYGKEQWYSSDLGGLYERWDDTRETKGYDGVPARINAAKAPGEWQTMEVIFRAPRFSNDGRKISHATFVKVLINGQLAHENVVAKGPTRAALYNHEEATGPLAIQGDHGPIAIRSLVIERLDLSGRQPESLGVPAPLDSNGRPLLDLVAIGKAAFKKTGCAECHAVTANSQQYKTGPNLFGLLRKKIQPHPVIDSAENHRIEVAANDDYVRRSIRDATRHLALDNEKPYLPVMPSYSQELLGDTDVDGIIAYLKTLNIERERGPDQQWISRVQAEYILSQDNHAVWVKDRPRLSRVDIGSRHSGRAYHVGLPNGFNYSFDPRTLGVVEIWSGAFLSTFNEKDGRGGRPSSHGFNAKVWPTQERHLFQPLYRDGSAVDFSFKEPAYVDKPLGASMVAYKGDYVAEVKAYQARFVGVNTPKRGAPGFRYRVDGNAVELQFMPNAGRIEARFNMTLKQAQSFLLPENLLSGIEVSAGTVSAGAWTLAPGSYKKVVFKARYIGAFDKAFVDEKIPQDSLKAQKLRWIKSAPKADLLSGYSVTDGVSPHDRFGRKQLFEPMGIDFLNKDVAFVATRTAGIWKISNGEWYLFAEGTFESLGVVAESEKSVVIGEKPGLTRLLDRDGDHWAESRVNLSDEFRFTGNYHEYLHGPIKYDNSYLYGLNLSNGVPGAYNAGGIHMDSSGGLRGWLCEINDKGEFNPFASGLRSPAGLGLSPSGEIIYTENQGEYVSTSKIFKVERGGFYGNPTGLIDLPGKNSDSPDVQWDAVKGRRERPLLLLPHKVVMNSPGNPVWDTTGGNFGPFSGQMLVGDQTQSNIYRIDAQEVNGVEQGVALPFADNLSSGVMRLAFNPADNSLWVGQTGRGWAARGGAISALQRISWDGSTPDAIQTVKATSKGFEIIFTKAQAQTDFGTIGVSSWHYRDSVEYGSPELGRRSEIVKKQEWSSDGRRCFIELENFTVSPRRESDTSRVYHIQLQGTAFGKAHSDFHAQAFYTLHSIPLESL